MKRSFFMSLQGVEWRMSTIKALFKYLNKNDPESSEKINIFNYFAPNAPGLHTTCRLRAQKKGRRLKGANAREGKAPDVGASSVRRNYKFLATFVNNQITGLADRFLMEIGENVNSG